MVFDIEAQYGFFRIAETTRATISFPFTRTSIIGVIGAILGYEKNTYWVDGNPLANAGIALELVNPIRHTALTVNYTHTKDTISAGKINFLLPQGPGPHFRGFVTDVRLDLIQEIHYLVYFQTSDGDLYSQVKQALKESQFIYPPYLGHANLLADIGFVGEFSINPIESLIAECDTVVAASQLSPDFFSLANSKLTFVGDIPVRMFTNNGKISAVATENFFIPELPRTEGKEKLKIQVLSDQILKRVNLKQTDEKIIVFMPDGRESKQITQINPLPNFNITAMPDPTQNPAKKRSRQQKLIEQ